MQIEPAAVAVCSFAHYALILESEALVEVPGTGIVVEDIEEEPVCTEFAEGDAEDFAEDAATEAAFRRSDHDALDFDGAGVFGEPAEDYVGVDSGSGFVDEVVGIGSGEGYAMPFFTPLADKLTSSLGALQGDDGGDVVGGG